MNIIEEIDHWAKKSPEMICYQENGRTHTYQELFEKSQQLAVYLEEQNLPKGPILVIGQLQFEMVVTFLACVKAGHAYIPVESHTPKERLAMIIQVSQPSLIIDVNKNNIERENYLGATDLARIFQNPVSQKIFIPKITNDFYLIFTSGTSGIPKGVVITHENVASFVEWELRDFPLGQKPRFLIQAAYSFDLSVMSLYPALVAGGTLVTLENEVIQDFKQLFTTLPTLKVDVWVSTPSFVDLCLMSPDFNEENLAELQLFLFCGEELMKATAEKLQERFPGGRIFNTYGPTETTVAVTQIEITPGILQKYPRLPIGFVKEDTEILIVDENLQILPHGQSGEIIISGPSVSKGYLNFPKKTAEAFIEIDHKRFYRTQDRGHFAGELLLYEGRLAFQVKLHGFRIELEDIDQNLLQVSYVKNACTVAKDKNGKTQMLVAFVVVKAHDFPSEFALSKAIKKELSEKVMDYMIPQRFIYLEKIPLTVNGKLDRKLLTLQVNGGQK
ncbi:D-alanine--poly(phosphoribitol) ligase subunit DltA [Enterococcus timonensis]|uniref:D-alanine--poly(phosphoribitol) ligase subunit DltA n=1 Tax=Enterococcus timonensis TaxID=1852364 RepID=UPI0008D90483|nr:D-alanine--poly(phosphoribitol) ligase subunit DltA [Enterococcus timonensis]